MQPAVHFSLLNNVIKAYRPYKRSSSSKVVLPSSEVMCNAPKYCHTTDLFVRDPNFLHATSRTTKTASFEANYCWMKDESVVIASGKKCHTELHIMLVSDDKVGLSRLKKNRGEVTFFFKFDRRVDGAKCNRPDPT